MIHSRLKNAGNPNRLSYPFPISMPAKLLRYASNRKDAIDACNDILIGYLELCVTSCR